METPAVGGGNRCLLRHNLEWWIEFNCLFGVIGKRCQLTRLTSSHRSDKKVVSMQRLSEFTSDSAVWVTWKVSLMHFLKKSSIKSLNLTPQHRAEILTRKVLLYDLKAVLDCCAIETQNQPASRRLRSTPTSSMFINWNVDGSVNNEKSCRCGLCKKILYCLILK